MPYKPVGIDENSRFPPRVNAALADMFVTKPVGIKDGEVPVWNAVTSTWVAGVGGSTEWVLPKSVDGGVWDVVTQSWINGSGPVDTPPEVDGGSPSSNT